VKSTRLAPKGQSEISWFNFTKFIDRIVKNVMQTGLKYYIMRISEENITRVGQEINQMKQKKVPM